MKNLAAKLNPIVRASHPTQAVPHRRCARVAVGSSLGIMIPMAFSGMIAKTLSSGSFPDGTFPVAIGALAGSIVGARLHRRLTPAKIRWGQTLLLVATFARILASLL